jgi:hypothetical protein
MHRFELRAADITIIHDATLSLEMIFDSAIQPGEHLLDRQRVNSVRISFIGIILRHDRKCFDSGRERFGPSSGSSRIA